MGILRHEDGIQHFSPRYGIENLILYDSGGALIPISVDSFVFREFTSSSVCDVAIWTVFHCVLSLSPSYSLSLSHCFFLFSS